MRGKQGFFLLIWVLPVVLTGCSPTVKRLDDLDRSAPLAMAGRTVLESGNVDAAIRRFTEALDQDPTLVRVHLDLALLLHDHDEDYVGALYHYGRYLVLRPDTEKRAMIEDRMRLARQLFAARILRQERTCDDEAAAAAARRIADLEDENRELKQELRLARETMDRAARSQTAETKVRPPADSLASEVVRTYRVAHGDTLHSIAEAMYGDSDRWLAIHKANKATIGSPEKLKPGQVLVIPR